MLLTLNQVLFIVITFAFVVAIVFLVLFLIQLRKTALEGQRTLTELRELAESLKGIEKKVNARIDDVGEIIKDTRKTVAGLSEATFFLTTKLVRPAFRLWPIVFPLARLGWQYLKKRKEKRDVR